MTAGDDKLLTRQTTKAPPARVLWFERLFYCSIFLSFVRIAIEWSDTMTPVTFGALYPLLMIQGILVWLASRRRKNWARWFLLFFFLTWAVTSLLRAGYGERPMLHSLSLASQVLKVAQLILEDIGLILVFTGNARRWFNPDASRQSRIGR